MEEKCMELTIKLLRILGTWPRWNQMYKLKEKIYLCYTGFMFFCMSVYLVILIYGFDTDWSLENMHIEDIIVFSTGLISFLKMLMIVRNQRQIQEVIDYINFDLNKRQLLTEDDRKQVLLCIKHEKLIIRFYVGMAAFMVMLFTLSSFMKMTNESWVESLEAKLPLTYAFPISDVRIFVVCYMHQFLVMNLNGVVGTLADALFSILVYYVCGHLTILKNRFLSQGNAIGKSCVDYHKEILRLIEWVEQIFRTFLFFMISINSFLICLGLLQLTQFGNTKRLSYEKSVIYLLIKVCQLFLYCWSGQEIIQRSSDVSFACYSTEWYHHIKKDNFENVKFILQMTQKPVEMKAGKFFSVSIATLKSVMNTAYSFFAMFRSIRK